MRNKQIFEKVARRKAFQKALLVNLIKSFLLAYMITGTVFLFSLSLVLFNSLTFGECVRFTISLFLSLTITFQLIMNIYSYNYIFIRKENLS